MGDRQVGYDTLFVATGARHAYFGDVEKDRVGRVLVGPAPEAEGLSRNFVLGDTACALDGQGKALPGLEPAAKQQDVHVASSIRARLAARAMPRFHYRNLGNLATIGRFAWLLWGLVHARFLIGFRSLIAVLTEWLWPASSRGAARALSSDRCRKRANPTPAPERGSIRFRRAAWEQISMRARCRIRSRARSRRSYGRLVVRKSNPLLLGGPRKNRSRGAGFRDEHRTLP
ncbi:MAG TPA: hypothetical protein VGV37_29035 [Aliidongia sp.]|uniref:hypothetical protein n=1 Tax=Aliidongia sp. TaxID=1914230 RepID=UPI002DDD5A8E|nr:hypothetical protein [Aliidongia sp.]HEV2678607.1 hypothetical protein [Aliidongia sp.]